MWDKHPEVRGAVPTLPHVSLTNLRPEAYRRMAESGRLFAATVVTFALLSAGQVHAQDASPPGQGANLTTSPAGDRPHSAAGEFSVSYAFPVLGGATAPNAGPVVRANLSFISEGREVRVSADPFGLRSQSVGLHLAEGDEALSLEYSRTPSTGVTPDVGARTDVQAVLVAKPDGAPTVQALLASQQVAGTAGNLSVVARLTLSDRYRDPYAGVSSIDWRTSAQTTTSTSAGIGTTGAGAQRTTTSSGFGVRAAFGGERSRTFRPTLDVDWSVTTAGSGTPSATVTHAWRFRTGLGIDVTPHEVVTLGADWDLRDAATDTTQTLAVTSDRLLPVRLSASVGRSSNSAVSTAGQAFNWSLDGDAPLGSIFTVGAGYRGEADADGSGHGARVRLSARSRTAGLTLRANLEAGGMWRSDAAFRPSASFTLAATTPDDQPLAFTVSTALKYDRRLAAAATAAATLRAGALSVTLDAKADYAGSFSLSGGATAAYDLFMVGSDRLGVQLGFEGLTTVGGASAASVDLGLRYAFGGDE